MGHRMTGIRSFGTTPPATITPIEHQVAFNGLLNGLSPDNGPIFSDYSMGAKLVGQFRSCLLGGGEHHQAASVLINSVNRPQFGQRRLRAA